MSQNIVVLIVFLALVVLVVLGTLVFSALVDRSLRRNDREPQREETPEERSGDAEETPRDEREESV